MYTRLNGSYYRVAAGLKMPNSTSVLGSVTAPTVATAQTAAIRTAGPNFISTTGAITADFIRKLGGGGEIE